MPFEKNHQLSKGRPKGSKGKGNQQIMLNDEIEKLKEQSIAKQIDDTTRVYNLLN